TPAEAVKILVDSSGYDFDPQIVKTMVSWFEQVRDRLDSTDGLTPDDLLATIKLPDRRAKLELAADVCATEG
ncbi:MAG: hypothetical protein ACYSWQ_17820, partial [Planctomycetota bacterium]